MSEVFGLAVKMLLVGTLAVASVMTLLWLLGLRHRNFSYVDLGWTFNFTLLAWLYAWLSDGYLWRELLICGMFTLWSLRLGYHLARRIIGQPEEGRYIQLREEWGASGNLNFKFLAFFQFQAALNILLSLPLLIACLNATPELHWLEITGVLVFGIGLLGESVADAQLAAFKRDGGNRGQVCDRGLWRYSRHPNYFFEWIIWVGYALFALGSPGGWLALITPALMLHFLINVTGVKPTEEQALRSKGERYREYQRKTSAFIPWFPKTRDLENRII